MWMEDHQEYLKKVLSNDECSGARITIEVSQGSRGDGPNDTAIKRVKTTRSHCEELLARDDLPHVEPVLALCPLRNGLGFRGARVGEARPGLCRKLRRQIPKFES